MEILSAVLKFLHAYRRTEQFHYALRTATNAPGKKYAHSWVMKNICHFTLYTGWHKPVTQRLPLVLVYRILRQFHQVAVDPLAVDFRFLNRVLFFHLLCHWRLQFLDRTFGLVTKIPAHFFGCRSYEQIVTRICIAPCKFVSRFLRLSFFLLKQRDQSCVTFRNQV